MLEHIRRLFSYNHWANQEFFSTLLGVNVPPAHSIRLLSHILSAERLWLERLRLQKQTQAVWPGFTLEACKSEIEQLAQLWQEYLNSLTEDDLLRSVTYKNSKGEDWTNQRQDILTHVILHSSYHRGQIAMTLRNAGFNPPYTDFIHAVRQQRVK
jgi:uncharacterized damage-inducible protein DinB